MVYVETCSNPKKEIAQSIVSYGWRIEDNDSSTPYDYKYLETETADPNNPKITD